MKIFILLPHLQGGGLERMRLNLIEELRLRGIEVWLVVGRLEGELVDLVSPDVPILEIAPRGPSFFFFALFKVLIKHKPTHILSAGDDINCMAIIANSLSRINAKVVVSGHNTLSEQLERAQGSKKALLIATKILMRLLYPKAARIVGVSFGVAEDLEKVINLPVGSVKVIYNPVVTSEVVKRVDEPNIAQRYLEGSRNIIYVGRLVPEKRLDLLIEMFSRVVGEVDASLIIVGAGPMKGYVENEARRRGLSDRIILTGFVMNVLPLMKACDVFVLPSDHEGAPNVLVEALLCGIPIVSTDCPSGPKEILCHGRYGILTPPGDAGCLSQAVLFYLRGGMVATPEDMYRRAMDFSSVRAADEYIEAFRT